MRINTIYFDFNEPEPPSNLQINLWLKELGFQNGEILSIQYNKQTKHVLVKLKSARQFEDFLVSNGPTSIFRQEGKDYLIPTGRDKSQVKIIKIRYIPLEAEIEEVIKKLGEYGTIGHFQRESQDYTKQNGFKYETEVIIVQIWITKDIPSFVRLEDYTANVWYPGQPQTCSKCDSAEHRVRDCPQNRPRRWEEKVNEERTQTDKEKENGEASESGGKEKDREEEEKADESNSEKEWVTPKKTTPQSFIVSGKNALPTETTNRFNTKPRSVSSERFKKGTARDPSRNLFAQVFNRHKEKEREERKSPQKDLKESRDERKRDESRDRKRKETEENDSDETEIEEIAAPEKVQRKGTPVKEMNDKEKGAEKNAQEKETPGKERKEKETRIEREETERNNGNNAQKESNNPVKNANTEAVEELKQAKRGEVEKLTKLWEPLPIAAAAKQQSGAQP
jgi:hypothetical protein